MLSLRVSDSMILDLVRLSKRTGKSISELTREFTEAGIRRAMAKKGRAQF